MVRRIAVILGACAMAVLQLSPAVLAQQQVANPRVSVDNPSPSPGQTVRITGSGWKPRSAVTVLYLELVGNKSPMPMATGIAGADGRIAVPVKIPSAVPLGNAAIRVEGTAPAGDPFSVYIALTVGGGGGMSYVARSLLLGLIFLGGVLLIAGTVYVSNRLFSKAGSDKRAAGRK